MGENEGTLNTADSSQAESTPQGVPVQSGDLVSTVDFQVPMPTQETDSSGETQKTQESDGSDKGQEGKDGDTKPGEKSTEADAGKDDDTSRFDKHPRFQQLISSNRAMKEENSKLQERLEALEKAQTKTPEEEDLQPPDMSELTEDLFEDDPAKAFKLMQQQQEYLVEKTKRETEALVKQQFEERQEAEKIKAVEKEYSEYAQKNPDFDEMWDSGEIQAFIDEHPGHTAISAHMAMTQEKKVQEAVDAALKDAEKNASNNRKTKQQAQVLGSGPSAGGYAANKVPAELKDTKKYGGLAAVLAARSLARTSQAP